MSDENTVLKYLDSEAVEFLYKNFGEHSSQWFNRIFIYITEKCQLSCKHCYLGFRLKRGRQMPFSQVEEHLCVWRELGATKVNFLGGEPTLHPDLEKAICIAHNLGYEEITITTNGIPPSLDTFARMSDKAKSYITYIQISLDGASPEIHEQIRGKNTYNFTVATIKNLCEEGFDTRIICTVNKLNKEDSLGIISKAAEWGVTLVKYHLFSVEGNGADKLTLSLNPLEWLEFTKTLLTVGKAENVRVLFQPSYSVKEDLSHWYQQGYRGCVGTILNRVSIFPDGKLYICSYLFDTEMHFACFKEHRIHLNEELNELDLFIATKRNSYIIEGQNCPCKCPAEQVVVNSYQDSESNNILPICRLWKAEV